MVSIVYVAVMPEGEAKFAHCTLVGIWLTDLPKIEGSSGTPGTPGSGILEM
jgi:hypothetical protein